jgi:outer membrane protein assembly factor BamB
MPARCLSGCFFVSAALQCLLAAECADWPQWGGSSNRNNVSDVRNLPGDWAPGDFDRKTGQWEPTTARNVKWVAILGSHAWGAPVIADGRIFMGTNNSNGYLKRYPSEVDLGCLLCFDEQEGKFQWQFSAEKLPGGRAHDWPYLGIASTPLVDGDQAWFVSNRGEVICLDTRGFHDEEDDGPVVGEYMSIVTMPAYIPRAIPDPAIVASLAASLDRGEISAELRAQFQRAGEELPVEVNVRVEQPGSQWSFTANVANSPRHYMLRVEGSLRAYRRQTLLDKQEADVVWRFDMMKQFGSLQHNLATCCITSWKDTLFICTSNGIDESHTFIPAPNAPSFFAMNKRSGEVLWTSNLPGPNILHGQWSAPAVGLLGGVPQVVFCGGDGWVYSFHAEQWRDQKPQLLWKFDANAKDAILELGGRGTRNDLIALPVLNDNKVYIATGQDPEHGEGLACIWCIDPTYKIDGSDVSPHKVVDRQGNEIPQRRKKNFLAWEEKRIYLDGNIDQLLDGGTVSNYLAGYLSMGRPQVPLANVRVTMLRRGVEWELQVAQDGKPETMYVWKRPHINDFGEREDIYMLARSTGERIVDNPDSAVVWKYDTWDRNGNGKVEFEEGMHRTICSVVIADGLLFCPDFSGLLHCLDAKTGRRHWTCDLLAACWSTPLVADGRLFVCDEDGDVAIFRLSADPTQAGAAPKIDPATGIVPRELQPMREINMGNAIYSAPAAANGALYISTKDRLFAIEGRAGERP